jgi:hypothetical protein
VLSGRTQARASVGREALVWVEGGGVKWLDKWLRKPCPSCDAKDERIASLLVDLESLKDMRAVAAKLEELAALSERKQGLLDDIAKLKQQELAKRKEQREVPKNVMAARSESRLPPL